MMPEEREKRSRQEHLGTWYTLTGGKPSQTSCTSEPTSHTGESCESSEFCESSKNSKSGETDEHLE